MQVGGSGNSALEGLSIVRSPLHNGWRLSWIGVGKVTSGTSGFLSLDPQDSTVALSPKFACFEFQLPGENKRIDFHLVKIHFVSGESEPQALVFGNLLHSYGNIGNTIPVTTAINSKENQREGSGRNCFSSMTGDLGPYILRRGDSRLRRVRRGLKMREPSSTISENWLIVLVLKVLVAERDISVVASTVGAES